MDGVSGRALLWSDQGMEFLDFGKSLSSPDSNFTVGMGCFGHGKFTGKVALTSDAAVVVKDRNVFYLQL